MLFLLMLACVPTALRDIAPGSIIELPDDQAAHKEAQTEWWHFHADLEQEDGSLLHVFAGFIVHRTDLDAIAGVPLRGVINPVQLSLVRIQDDTESWTADRLNFPDFFAASLADEGLKLRHNDWYLEWKEGSWILRASAGPHKLDLVLTPGNNVMPGSNGVFELRPGERHHWVQHEKIEVTGDVGGKPVTGTAFCKHQWGRIWDEAYDGFEWISMDLPSSSRIPQGGALSIIWLREGEQRGVGGSAAWLSGPSGLTEELALEELRLQPTKSWKSPRSKASWIAAWELTGPDISLVIEPLDIQEEIYAFPMPMHLGPARVQGDIFGEEVDLLGFTEQAGERIPPFRWLVRSDAP